jgi:molybdopterin converting factor subunit 1
VQVRTLFFASLRDLAGTGESLVELPEGSSVADLLAVISREQVELGPLGAAAAVAVNQVYSGPETILEEGDEVAFIPPVAGG